MTFYPNIVNCLRVCKSKIDLVRLSEFGTMHLGILTIPGYDRHHHSNLSLILGPVPFYHEACPESAGRF